MDLTATELGPVRSAHRQSQPYPSSTLSWEADRSPTEVKFRSELSDYRGQSAMSV